MAKRKTHVDGLYRRPDAKSWWASYTDASGKRTRRSTGASDRKEAADILAKWKLETRAVTHWDAAPIRTFDELMLAYLDGPSADKRSDRDHWSTKHLAAAFAEREMQSIRPSEITAYIASRRKAGAQAGTVNREIGLLSAAINWANSALEWELPNPAQGRRLAEPEGRMRWLQFEEAEQLIAAAGESEKAPHLPDFIRLALNTGCRSGELLNLEWARVDLTRRTIALESMHTKAGKRRTVPLNEAAREALLGRARFRAEHCPGAAHVFVNAQGERIKSIKRSFATACRNAGIEDFHIHDLRHTCAAWLVSAGIPLSEIRDLLGHSSVTMTERYSHLAPERVRRAVGILDSKSRFGHGEVGDALSDAV